RAIDNHIGFLRNDGESFVQSFFVQERNIFVKSQEITILLIHDNNGLRSTRSQNKHKSDSHPNKNSHQKIRGKNRQDRHNERKKLIHSLGVNFFKEGRFSELITHKK